MAKARLLVSLLASWTSAPLAAQETNTQAPPEPDRAPLVIDILAPVAPLNEGAGSDLRECREEQDAAQITGEIIVCRERAEDAGSGFDKSDWERRYAERTLSPVAPNLDGLANGPVYRTDGSVFMVTIKRDVGEPPPPALIIEIKDLPEAPPDSDAARVGEGLPAREGD